MVQSNEILGIKYLYWWKWFRLCFIVLHIWVLSVILINGLETLFIMILPFTLAIPLTFLNLLIDIEEEPQTKIKDFYN